MLIISSWPYNIQCGSSHLTVVYGLHVYTQTIPRIRPEHPPRVAAIKAPSPKGVTSVPRSNQVSPPPSLQTHPPPPSDFKRRICKVSTQSQIGSGAGGQSLTRVYAFPRNINSCTCVAPVLLDLHGRSHSLQSSLVMTKDDSYSYHIHIQSDLVYPKYLVSII